MAIFQKLSKDLEFIKKTKFWVEEGPAFLHLCIPGVLGFLKLNKFLPFACKNLVMVFKDNYGWQALSETESYQTGKNFAAFLNVKRQRDWFRLSWQNNIKKLFKFVDNANEESLVVLNNQELLKHYKRFLKLFVEAWSLPLIFEGGYFYQERELLPELKEQLKRGGGRKKANVNEIFAFLTQPEELSFSARERISFLRLALMFQKEFSGRLPNLSSLKNQNFKLFNHLSKHQGNFFWARNNYIDCNPLSVDSFYKLQKQEIVVKSIVEIEAEIAKIEQLPLLSRVGKARIISRFNLTKKIVGELRQVALMAVWQDLRKEVNLKGNYFLGLFLKEFARRTGMALKYLVNLWPEDLANIFDLEPEEILKRAKLNKRGAFVCLDGKSWNYYTGEPFKRIFAALLTQGNGMGPDYSLSGMTVSRGGLENLEGEVCVVLDVKRNKFKEGAILITSMTRPEFVPIMNKAKAIITNEGGMTCHAAIISRELNIPCIVGVKSATKIFKNGDRVLMRLNYGKIEKK